MKSNNEQLKNRGYISEIELDNYKNTNEDTLVNLLSSEDAQERTIAAKIIGKKKILDFLPILCETLKNEKKLYTKIAICEAIEKYGTSALEYLIPLIGIIGNNQHKKVDLIDIKKKSYPLPRDIVTRIIIRIGVDALPFLETLLENGTYLQKIETIDAIGHITYHHNNYRSERVLLNFYFKNIADELIKWKIIRAFQAFNSIEIVKILDELKNSNNLIFQEEAKRSLKQIKKREMRKYT